MGQQDWLAARFEEHRPHLRQVAYRMLGSRAEADDAVQDAWLRLSRAGAEGVDNLGGWLTTVVARLCLNVLRSRNVRGETSLSAHVPDPVVSPEGDLPPEEEAVLADTVGLALLVVLDTLTPAERLAFVLHDMFSLPFEDIAEVVGRSPAAARQLASRARRRVRGAEVPIADVDHRRQRQVVDAFLRATRRGDFDALIEVLDPDVVVRIDTGPRGPATMVLHGAPAVAGQVVKGLTSILGRPTVRSWPMKVNGTPGVVLTMDGRPAAVMGFVVVDGKIAEIDSLADPERVGLVAADMATDA